MKTVIVFILVAVSNGYYNRGSVAPIMEYQTKQACEASVERNKKPILSGTDFYLDCLEIVKEVGSD